MFDIGFSQIAIIGVVALIVLGPERLPRLARVAGTLLGRAQRYLRDVKDEVSKDMALADLKDMGQSIKDDFNDVEKTVRDQWSAAENVVRGASNIGQSYAEQPYPAHIAKRTGRAHWRVKTGRVPQWYKQQNGIKSRVTSEAARMARHRRYAAHTSKPKVSFFV